MRACTKEDFGGLRLVMAAAEKLPDRLATAFEEKFGIRPVEGYGCTECSPAVSVNTHDFRAPGYRQVGTKRGTIGHPLPGMTVRIVDPETQTPLPIGEAGLLLVRGPNVMKGYLGKPEKTAEVLRDEWYCTGDIAAVDEDGFLQIRDRLSRFSKIGGEMVPHINVEETLHELSCVTEQTFVVTGVPDESKGERLVVLHTATDAKLKECLEKLPNAGLPNLWIPRANQFYRVQEIPILGTGKLDLRKIKEQALRLSAENTPKQTT
jgi:acyl-[acyl-carrier-protein]-phospholipid O-acyltransferase/long-chain-fatty-acid--[acyl-carrier-protein] ligase